MRLKGTRTAENLLKSFAGESQARMRYTYYSSLAKKEGYVEIANILMEIAEQEKEHAKRFYKFLKEDFKDEGIEITSTYPVSYHDNTLDNLKAAASGENEEWTVLYPEFAKEAREEGFDDIAKLFDLVAKIEAHHEERYKKLIDNINNSTVFKSEGKKLWICRNCGHIHYGESAPKVCPTCKHPQAYFEIMAENF